MVGGEELHVLVQCCTSVYEMVKNREDTSVMIYNNMVVIEGGKKGKKRKRKKLY